MKCHIRNGTKIEGKNRAAANKDAERRRDLKNGVC